MLLVYSLVFFFVYLVACTHFMVNIPRPFLEHVIGPDIIGPNPLFGSNLRPMLII